MFQHLAPKYSSRPVSLMRAEFDGDLIFAASQAFRNFVFHVEKSVRHVPVEGLGRDNLPVHKNVEQASTGVAAPVPAVQIHGPSGKNLHHIAEMAAGRTTPASAEENTSPAVPGLQAMLGFRIRITNL